MSRLTSIRCAALACAVALLAAVRPVHAQSYPERTVKIVIPSPAGGGLDTLARAVAQGLSAKWSQPVVVENRPGSATILGADAVAKSRADGYTLLLTSETAITVNPALYAKLPYELGFAEVPAYAWFGLFAPAGTPSDTIQKIARDVREIASSAAFQQREVQARGYEPVFNTPQEFARVLEVERVQATHTIKISGDQGRVNLSGGRGRRAWGIEPVRPGDAVGLTGASRRRG